MARKIKLRLQPLLVMSISSFVIFLLIVQGSFLSTSISELITTEIYDTSEEILLQKNIRLNDRIQEIRQLALSIVINKDITDGLRDAGQMNVYEQLEYIKNTENLLSTVVNSRDDIGKIVIVNDNLNAYNYARINGVIESRFIGDASIIESMSVQDEGFITTKENYFDNQTHVRYVLTYFVQIYGEYKKPLGTLCITLNEKEIREIIESESRSTSDNITYIVTEDNDIVSPYGDDVFDTKYYKLIQASIENQPEDENEKIDLLGASYLRTESSKNTYGMKVVQLMPYASIDKEVKALIGRVFNIGVICVVIAFLFLTLFSNSITKPIKHLLDQMHQVGKGKFNVTRKPGVISEIVELNEGFDRMTTQIENLIIEVEDKHTKMRQAEFSALQSQINPHFLYNTLDSINWMAIKVKAHDISQMVEYLGKFFRLSLNRGRDFTSIHNEIEHLRIYMKMQLMRYNNKFEFIEDYDPDIQLYQTIKLILQPFLENALIHGLAKTKGRGRIEVHGRDEEDKIVFYISDDGEGVDVQYMNRLLNHLENMDESYGIRNVHQRIRIHYGDDYGISYIEVDKGTMVKVEIPKVDMSEVNNNV